MEYPQTLDPGSAAMGGRCPRCGQGKLFDGYLSVRDRCDVCDLDFSFADSGDGPAFFVMSIVGFLAVVVVMVCLIVFEMVAGLALIIGFVFTMVTTLAILRPAKGLMIGLQYKNNAHEGRVR
ncbi:DUF983 domain-containing protein [Parvularcula lutaonensis]|uniref:DUF983 domain-containing protein n=1 Tax=Parvularcula lutaonensis TaxID=491923 RepID=A0ABV7MC98_9PROT|nr:DUF983 domain-containing protein [Parvularcula lutaonensis]GGY50173.1 membrane protein [Parvularcula lutaonensis]